MGLCAGCHNDFPRTALKQATRRGAVGRYCADCRENLTAKKRAEAVKASHRATRRPCVDGTRAHHWEVSTDNTEQRCRRCGMVEPVTGWGKPVGWVHDPTISRAIRLSRGGRA